MRLNRCAFLVGFHEVHEDKHVNYHLNRWYSVEYWTRDEANRVAAGVRARDEFKGIILAFAEDLAAQKRDLAAAIGYQAAEFFSHPQEPDMIPLYDPFHERYYAAIQDEQYESHSFPYRAGIRPALLRFHYRF